MGDLSEHHTLAGVASLFEIQRNTKLGIERLMKPSAFVKRVSLMATQQCSSRAGIIFGKIFSGIWTLRPGVRDMTD